METQHKTPEDVSFQLDISPTMLRRWTDELSEFLSNEANSISANGHRRYTTLDIERLQTAYEYIKEDGMTYEEVRRRFREDLEIPTSGALISNDASAANMVMGYISESMENVRQGQVSVLNSQAANRELMGVVIQDNFNLKEENTRLRERILDVERQLGTLRREEMMRRESLRREVEMKIMEIRDTVSKMQNPPRAMAAEADEFAERPGCLASLFRRQPEPDFDDEDDFAPPPPPPSRPNYPRPAPARPPGPPE